MLAAARRFGKRTSAPIVQRRERRRIRLIYKIHLIAFVVGFCIIAIPSATPLELTTEARAQLHPKPYAHALVMKQWKKRSEYVCLVELWRRESNWNPKAHNKSSGAFGIAQFMPSTWANYKYPYKPKSASVQITAGLRYITKRYGSPCAAKAFWDRNNWY